MTLKKMLWLAMGVTLAGGLVVFILVQPMEAWVIRAVDHQPYQWHVCHKVGNLLTETLQACSPPLSYDHAFWWARVARRVPSQQDLAAEARPGL